MLCPESIKQAVVATLLGVVLNPHDLRVVGVARAHILIAGVVEEALTVANLGLGHPGNSLESQFDTPEAPGAELRELLARGRNVIVWALSNRGRVGGRGPGGAEAELVEQAPGG